MITANELAQHELGYWYVVQKPSLEELKRYYAEKYYQDPSDNRKPKWTESELAFFKTKVVQKQAMLERVIPNHGKSMLDVGCGQGFALAHFHSQGWTVKGIDFSEAGIRQQNPQCLDVFQAGDIYQLLAEEVKSGSRYSVVWLHNVLEHVLDPLQLLKSLKQLVASDGCAVITVPNDFSALQEAAIASHKVSKPFWVAPPDHLSYFDAASLQKTTEYCGWSTLAVTADFPIDWFLFNEDTNYIEDPSKGKNVHHARVDLENLIGRQSMDKVLDLWQSLAAVGMGRSITAFVTPR